VCVGAVLLLEPVHAAHRRPFSQRCQRPKIWKSVRAALLSDAQCGAGQLIVCEVPTGPAVCTYRRRHPSIKHAGNVRCEAHNSDSNFETSRSNTSRRCPLVMLSHVSQHCAYSVLRSAHCPREVRIRPSICFVRASAAAHSW
jgi:hypothetical protein